MMNTVCRALVVLILALPSCSDENTSATSTQEVQDAFNVIQEEPKADIVEDTPSEDVLQCSDVDKSSTKWCSCHPQCCQAQQWFCQPEFGNPAYFKKEVIVEICGDDLEPCLYGVDNQCPPPELLHEGECLEAYECPPGSQSLDYGWMMAQLENNR